MSNTLCLACDKKLTKKPKETYQEFWNRKFCDRTCFNENCRANEEKECCVCKIKYKKPSKYTHREWDNSKYCSVACKNLGQKGKTTWNKGKIYMPDHLNTNWKADSVGYSALHKWVTRKKGRKLECDSCHYKGSIKEKRFFHWANIDHTYTRDLDKWIRMCAKCHKNSDKLLRDKVI